MTAFPSPRDFVVLADVQPFRLGTLEVRPAVRQVVRGGDAHAIEPRVMQTLVILAEARGEVVSHDMLIDRAWGGRVVGEGAVHRVISRLRHLLAETGESAFELQNIPKVGYRLIERPAETCSSPVLKVLDVAPPIVAMPAEVCRPLPRRALILGAVAAAGLGAIGYGWRRSQPKPAIGAEGPLIELARTALRQDLPEGYDQAIAYLRHATEIAPRSAHAWGVLASAYVRLLDHDVPGETEDTAARARSAALTALAIDPGQRDAANALLLIRPSFRRWLAAETDLRRGLGRAPGDPVLQAELAELWLQTGRESAALPVLLGLLARDPMQIGLQVSAVWADWASGSVLQAETRMRKAIQLWPRHRYLWLSSLVFLIMIGNGAAAMAAMADERSWPSWGARERPSSFETYAAAATALSIGATDGDRAIAADLLLATRAAGDVSSPIAVPLLAALGRLNEAFMIAERYYFGGGGPDNIRSGPGPYSRRITSVLFMPPTTAMRRDPRFAVLTRRLGLDDYWRANGMRPDYRT